MVGTSPQPGVLVADLAELVPKVGMPLQADPAAIARAVQEWLETTTRPWLLVFDNAPDEASVKPWRPRREICATVITSRDRNVGRIGEVVQVDTFPLDVAERSCSTGCATATLGQRPRTSVESWSAWVGCRSLSSRPRPG